VTEGSAGGSRVSRWLLTVVQKENGLLAGKSAAGSRVSRWLNGQLLAGESY
jgi:hypothetical protein